MARRGTKLKFSNLQLVAGCRDYFVNDCGYAIRARWCTIETGNEIQNTSSRLKMQMNLKHDSVT